MNTQELLELAGLDALGLLDEEERAAFERGFMGATPAVQAQVRREQARIACNDQMLPKVEPPMGLKARVLAAMREAVAAIPGARTVAGRIGPEGIERSLTIARPRGVNALWRVGAVGSLAAAIALGVVFLNMRRQFDDLDAAFRADQLAAILAKEFNPRFESMMMAPSTQFVTFNKGPGEGRAQALMLIDRAANSGELYGTDLPIENGNYKLVLIGPDGQQSVLAAFRATGTRFYEKINEISLERDESVAIVGEGSEGASRTVLTGKAL